VHEPDTSLRVQSLLAAKTKQEVEAIVAEAFDTASEPHLDGPLEALLSRSASRTQTAAAASATGTSGGGASSEFSYGGASDLSTGAESNATEKLSAEIDRYRQQLAELQQELDAKAAAAATAEKLSTGTQEMLAQLSAELVAAQAESATAQAAHQELQQQRAAAEEARQQLNKQLLEVQAANADLLKASTTLQRDLDAARVLAEDLQAEKQALQQQASRVAALEAEVEQLQQQLRQLLSHKSSVQDAATEADLASPRRNGDNQVSTAGSSAAVSAVRAATHNLLLQSNPFEVSKASVCRRLVTHVCTGGVAAICVDNLLHRTCKGTHQCTPPAYCCPLYPIHFNNASAATAAYACGPLTVTPGPQL
jgi:DNA repair exonuclease SbcCD ATPase subunit